MKKLFSVKHSAGAINAALLILRLGTGILMMNHGYDKLIHFDSRHNTFMNFLGIGSSLSFALLIFAEFFCSLFLMLGLFTRLATVPLIIAMGVALFQAKNGDIFGKGEVPGLYLMSYVVILLAGPGRLSIDGMVGK